MTAAHCACLSRIPLCVLGVFFVLEMGDWGSRAAAAIVALAGLTDILDGYFARRFGTASPFGSTLDLTADKAFTIPMLFVAAGQDSVVLWLAVIVAMRELLIMGMRLHAAAEGVAMPAGQLGKLKVLALYSAIGLLLWDVPGAVGVLGLAAALAVASGVEYTLRIRKVLLAGLRRNGAYA